MKVGYRCGMKWEELEGSGNLRRHCGSCGHDVFNLDGLTVQQAKKVIWEHQGTRLCVRFTKDGYIQHGGNPFEQLSSQRSGINKLVAGAIAVQVAFAALADDPGQYFFDPFATLAQNIVETTTQVETKFEDEYQGGEVMGVMF